MTESSSAGARPRRNARLPVVVNTDAGTAPDVLDTLEKDGGFEVHACCGADVVGTVGKLMAAGHRRIVAAGGDGTIGSAASVLTRTDVELAIVPGGTLNHFARDHGIPGDTREALELARNGAARGTDVGCVNDRVFLNTSSVGAYVSLVRMRDDVEARLGYTLGSLVAAVRVFFTIERFAVEISTPDGERILRTPLLFVGVGERELKLPSLGGRVEAGRSGLHVMVVKGRTRGAILALAFGAAVRGIRGVRAPHLDAMVLDRCTVQLRRRTLISLDGEVVTLQSPLRYELLRGALRLVRPA